MNHWSGIFFHFYEKWITVKHTINHHLIQGQYINWSNCVKGIITLWKPPVYADTFKDLGIHLLIKVACETQIGPLVCSASAHCTGYKSECLQLPLWSEHQSGCITGPPFHLINTTRITILQLHTHDFCITKYHWRSRMKIPIETKYFEYTIIPFEDEVSVNLFVEEKHIWDNKKRVVLGNFPNFNW